jgi:hypothetical protein
MAMILSEVGSKPEENDFEIKRNKRRQKKKIPLSGLNKNQGNGNAKSLKAKQQGWKKQGGKQKRGDESRRTKKRRRLSDT